MRSSPRFLSLIAAAAVVAGAACTDNNSASSTATSTTVSGSSQSATAPAVARSATSSASTAAGGAGSGSNGRTGTTAAVMDSATLARQVRPSVVRVRAGAGSTGGFSAQNTGTGTGFVIDAQGYIVTNNHVVTLGNNRLASDLKVDLADGRSLDARLVGRDERTDVAVLKVEASGLQALRFADPQSVEVGEDVLAVGFALDLGGQPTVTKGVVSALDREINETGIDGQPINISGAIQTDAAINPGNSGGPLLDSDGNVLGINTAGLRGGGTTSVQGISFAVSSAVAQPIVNALIKDGAVRRGYLGVSVSAVDRQRAQALGLNISEGVRIEQVQSGQPAERAGLRAGDVIVKANNIDIKNLGDLTRALTPYTSNQSLQVEFVRDGQRQSVAVTPTERPSGA